MRYVVFYESSENMFPRAQEIFPAHQARWQSYVERGELVGIGPFGDPQNEGSMGVFTTREAAEEFVAGDPFVLEGLVKHWYIREWNDALAR